MRHLQQGLFDRLECSGHIAQQVRVPKAITHAKDENARRWYEQFDLEPSPTDPLHLFLLLKDLKKLLKWAKRR
ncbi:MAG: hypothetical protein WAU33_10110 [Candidatus Binataceae bacterium]